ncbi:hypothetical protein FOMPIDRAFT_1055712 [Fomitopsis schrenkii]|uniref:Uncharacterized protein n=1 Tax=Fomitopsis schrenkii TaxID=2126942 RepID=S8DM77_FOMSC|nr:hypothetical protein FOMPIDRAFT_1055712 [Fomitopsis schrenkii]
MSTVNSKTALCSASSDSLARWPILRANLSVSTGHAADDTFFHAINIEYLCLAGLGMSTCDMRLGPLNSFQHVRFTKVVWASRPLDMYGWMDVSDIGLFHLTRQLNVGNLEIFVFQGWFLESANIAALSHRAELKPCIIYLPRDVFSSKTLPKPMRQISRLKAFWQAIHRFG